MVSGKKSFVFFVSQALKFIFFYFSYIWGCVHGGVNIFTSMDEKLWVLKDIANHFKPARATVTISVMKYFCAPNIGLAKAKPPTKPFYCSGCVLLGLQRQK
jgi:hypothetical protein